MNKSNEFKNNLKVNSVDNNKTNSRDEKVIATPMFYTEEQERIFKKCSRASMSIWKKLWKDDKELKVKNRVMLTPIFSTKEQEELFAKCAKESMSTEAELHWDGEQDDER